jgi:energy-coupling factor transport system substrate-specific component
MSTTVMERDRGMWDVGTRTIVYAAIGAALYAVAAQFQFIMPGTANVSVRPGFALVPFFGFAFGPIVGLFVGLVGNAVADQISSWGLLTSWNWSIAVGVVGMLAGIFAMTFGRTFTNRYVLAAVASVVAIVIGFIVVFSDIWLGTADDFGVALTANYLPAVLTDGIASAILVPLLVAAWEPIREAVGR